MNVTWDFTDKKVTKDEIVNVGDYWNIQFPDDYVNIACESHGGSPIPDSFDFENHEEAVFGYLLSFNHDSINYIITTYENVKDRLPSDVIPIADDPFGNLICFDFRMNNKNPKVVFWDHEIAFTNPDRAISFISSSFSDLINKLYEV
ncbi:hypothetical protein PAECIP111891_04485 [Paenibacillus allorhizoplanae]|uniref:SMI1/KNR4 family protein n=1 Tax=Paenibacillus allorhizoplanae TaxID=2905648 RepID=A0ABN8GZV2_9BACL|nr:SMI1/KNR4 family protein [Paenibacillus allorhizoplanae]CAH1216830.1 hypothetical protein PAECIP111891_04485 [Paenibacillus allorhizoplanae]